MPVDQAEKLRLMVRSTAQRARVIAITSGKGGVGKSNIAANLAICLAASGKDVILLDGDLGLANLDVVLNIRARHTLAEVITDHRPLDEIIQPAPGGIRIICGASGLTLMADLDEFERHRILQELATLEHDADYIIIDTGAGISPDVLGFCSAADRTIVVTTPEPAAITDAYAVIKRLTQIHSGMKISLLPNMVESRAEAQKLHQRLAAVSQKFLSATLYNAGYILRDEHLALAVRQREPLVLAYPRCQASYCIMALAGKIARTAGVANTESGFFRKVVNWFF